MKRMMMVFLVLLGGVVAFTGCKKDEKSEPNSETNSETKLEVSSLTIDGKSYPLDTVFYAIETDSENKKFISFVGFNGKRNPKDDEDISQMKWMIVIETAAKEGMDLTLDDADDSHMNFVLVNDTGDDIKEGYTTTKEHTATARLTLDKNNTGTLIIDGIMEGANLESRETRVVKVSARLYANNPALNITVEGE